MFESTVVCGRIALGIQGEHHARKVSFAETQLWKERFGEGRFELLHQRNGDVAPYPINMTIENDVPYWYVTASDTAVAGVGKCELRYIVNDVVIKSCTFITDVDASLGEGTEAPEPYKAWVDEVFEAAEDVKEATVHQPIIGENGNWWVWDFNASAYVDTGVSVSGGGNVDLTDYVKNTDYASADKGGAVKIRDGYGLNISNGVLSVRGATESNIDAENEYMPITPKHLKYAVAKGGEGHFAKEDAVFEKGSFVWTDFEYTADEEAFADIKDNSIGAGSSYPITIHCKGKVIGFTASSNGSYYKLKVNGNNVLENTSWSTVSQTYTLPPTLMTEDIVVELSVSQIDFTDMTIQSIKGVSELESQIGDIDTALDSILDIQNGLIGGDAV